VCVFERLAEPSFILPQLEVGIVPPDGLPDHVKEFEEIETRISFLLEVIVRPVIERPDCHLFPALPGEDDYGYIVATVLDHPEEVDSVHPGQFVVHHDRIVVIACYLIECFGP